MRRRGMPWGLRWRRSVTDSGRRHRRRRPLITDRVPDGQFGALIGYVVISTVVVVVRVVTACGPYQQPPVWHSLLYPGACERGDIEPHPAIAHAGRQGVLVGDSVWSMTVVRGGVEVPARRGPRRADGTGNPGHAVGHVRRRRPQIPPRAFRPLVSDTVDGDRHRRGRVTTVPVQLQDGLLDSGILREEREVEAQKAAAVLFFSPERLQVLQVSNVGVGLFTRDEGVPGPPVGRIGLGAVLQREDMIAGARRATRGRLLGRRGSVGRPSRRGCRRRGSGARR